MHQGRTGAACLRLPQGEPGSDGQADADEDMLRENAPGEGNENPCKLVDGPEADELRIVEPPWNEVPVGHALRSEEHTSELQSLMRISYAVFCLKKKKSILTQRD